MNKARLLKGILERILLRAFYVAAILALSAGILLDRLHTPVYVYILLFACLIVLAIYADRWFVSIYKILTKVPSLEVVHIDYSQLRRQSSLVAVVRFQNRSVQRKIRRILISIQYGPIIFKGMVNMIARESLDIDKKVKADETITINIPLIVASEDFKNEAEGASNQQLPMPLTFSFRWEVNPIIWGVLIPETIHYRKEVTYDKSPDLIF